MKRDTVKSKILAKLQKLAEKAYKKNEVPVGSVLVQNNQIIAQAHNNKEAKHDVLGHAEVIVIKKAAKKLKTWKLDNAILYTTLEPCSMCKEVIKSSRIKKVYYLSKTIKKINYKTNFIFKETLFFESILKKFFKNKRL